LIFTGVVFLAATLCSLVGKWWLNPTSAIVLGAVGGASATIMENSVTGAILGLLIGLLVAANMAARVFRYTMRMVGASAYGAAVGGVANYAYESNEGWLQYPAAVGIGLLGLLGAGFLVALMRRPDDAERYASIKSWWRWANQAAFLSFAAAGGVTAFAASRHVETREHVARLQEIGAEVDYAPLPWIERAWLTIRGSDNIDAVDLAHADATDEDLDWLARADRLKRLVLSGSQVTDSGMERLRDLTRLEDLDLRGTEVGDEGLSLLSNVRSIRNLSLAGGKVTDDGLDHLAQMTKLKNVDLSQTAIDGSGLKNLNRLPELVTLKLAGSDVTDDGLAAFHSKNLKQLDLSDTNVSAASLPHLSAAFPQLEELKLSGLTIGDRDLRALLAFKHLDRLHLDRTLISRHGGRALKKQMRETRIFATLYK
jgi:hypothetical protein